MPSVLIVMSFYCMRDLPLSNKEKASLNSASLTGGLRWFRDEMNGLGRTNTV